MKHLAFGGVDFLAQIFGAFLIRYAAEWTFLHAFAAMCAIRIAIASRHALMKAYAN